MRLNLALKCAALFKSTLNDRPIFWFLVLKVFICSVLIRACLLEIKTRFSEAPSTGLFLMLF